MNRNKQKIADKCQRQINRRHRKYKKPEKEWQKAKNAQSH